MLDFLILFSKYCLIFVYCASWLNKFKKLKDNTLPPKITLVSVPREDIRALMCSIYDFYPEKLTVKWKKNEIEETGFTTWPPKSFRNTFSAVSVLNVKNTDWDSKAVYTCEVTHKGKLYMKKASKGTSLIQCYPNTAVYLLQLNCKQ
uniref:Ig-like domain-containing protein n=1 Tax=Labrus bergylta TaxID=56723 RepID=A0A3Q3FI75_9LABR